MSNFYILSITSKPKEIVHKLFKFNPLNTISVCYNVKSEYTNWLVRYS